MKLKSGCIFWQETYQGPRQAFPKLDHDIKCDVAIVGGGITGALVAYYLTREGIHTVMVDRREVGHGSTAASTGLLQYEIDTPLTKLISKIGKDHAQAAYRASANSLLEFEPLVAELGDRCGLIRRPSLYLASRENEIQEFRDECEARRAIKIDVNFLERHALAEQFTIRRPAALWSKLALAVDPYRFTQQLIRRSVQNGLDVFTHTEVVRCQPDSKGMTLYTSSGGKVEARKIVFAAGYETIGLLPADLCTLASTFAVCSEPVDDSPLWPQECLIWESARPYLYMRTTDDARVIVGGEDEDIIDPRQRDPMIESKTQRLCERFDELFPKTKLNVTCAWAGTFAQTKDGLPYIGSLPKFPHCYFALGYGGNGITFSLIAAEIIRDSFLARPNDRAHLFRFDR